MMQFQIFLVIWFFFPFLHSPNFTFNHIKLIKNKTKKKQINLCQLNLKCDWCKWNLWWRYECESVICDSCHEVQRFCCFQMSVFGLNEYFCMPDSKCSFFTFDQETKTTYANDTYWKSAEMKLCLRLCFVWFDVICVEMRSPCPMFFFCSIETYVVISLSCSSFGLKFHSKKIIYIYRGNKCTN